MKVLIDMDGVIADYEKGFEELIGISIADAKAAGEFEEIKEILHTMDFFNRLPPMPLVEILRKHPGKWAVCTAVSEFGSEKIAEQKEDWLYDYFQYLPEFHWVVKSRMKAEYASENTLLIDDRDKCLEPFSAAGGLVYKFHNTPDDLKYIDELLENL